MYKPFWFVLAQTDGADLPPAPIPAGDRARALQVRVTEILFDVLDGNVMGYACGRSIAVSPMNPQLVVAPAVQTSVFQVRRTSNRLDDSAGYRSVLSRVCRLRRLEPFLFHQIHLQLISDEEQRRFTDSRQARLDQYRLRVERAARARSRSAKSKQCNSSRRSGASTHRAGARVAVRVSVGPVLAKLQTRARW